MRKIMLLVLATFLLTLTVAASAIPLIRMQERGEKVAELEALYAQIASGSDQSVIFRSMKEYIPDLTYRGSWSEIGGHSCHFVTGVLTNSDVQDVAWELRDTSGSLVGIATAQYSIESGEFSGLKIYATLQGSQAISTDSEFDGDEDTLGAT